MYRFTGQSAHGDIFSVVEDFKFLYNHNSDALHNLNYADI